jgi:hypothetical protein
MIAPMMEAARTSETLVNFYQTTRRYNPEDSHLQIECIDRQLQPARLADGALSDGVFVFRFSKC